ncbi:hypothetical protein QYE76_008320 [Lolium multiflorum]|uniref:DUF4283 domain-containing protein n=1 Tax=Lolium multiflorum TaxID=4521 RepID=A0AAD8PP20_LOLMU|nr:hypothetical protein QYE76_008320 [Lolium multiflorum]
MAPPGGGGDYGEPGEGSTRPKPTGGQPTTLQHGRATKPVYDRSEASDGNWDDGDGMDEEPGLRQGHDTNLGGEVDMDDDVFLEFDEEDEVPVSAESRTAWRMLARYRAHTRPNARDMFTYFSDVWHLRNQIKYTELQKNYYILTFFSQGDFDFVARGGPWIFKKNALLVKEIKDNVSPSDMILDAVPVWVRVYDVLCGKQNYETGMKFGNLLGKAFEVDAPTEEKDMNEFLRVRKSYKGNILGMTKSTPVVLFSAELPRPEGYERPPGPGTTGRRGEEPAPPYGVGTSRRLLTYPSAYL